MPARVQHQQAYILHTRHWSESSLLIDAFSRTHGRVSLLAKGARRIKSKVRGLIRPFQSLLLSWSGKGELQVLTGAETESPVTMPDHQSWVCGCYMNELLIKTLHKYDPHEQLYDFYDTALADIFSGVPRQIVLRLFEKRLLGEIGYGLLLSHDANSQQPVIAGKTYNYYPDRGPILAANSTANSVWQVSGSTLLALDVEYFPGQLEVEQSKRLLRALINQSLRGRTVKSRQVLQNIKLVQ